MIQQRNNQDVKTKKIHEVESISTQMPGRPDTLFLCASSFEDRCRTVPLHLPTNGYRSYYSVMFNYYQKVKENRHFFNRTKIYDALSSITINKPVKPIDCDRLKPNDGVRKIFSFLKEHNIKPTETRITIDISTFTKQYILRLLYDIEEFFQTKCSIRILYTEPAVYWRGVFKRLSYGVEDVVIVPKFEGKTVPDGKTALIVFLGYESHRTLATIKKYEPDLTIAVIGDPPYYPGWDKYSISAHSNLLSKPDVRKYKMSAKDPGAVKEELSKVWNELNKDYPNMYIAPVGTKLQTVGIYEFVRYHPTVKIVYPIPKGYLESYYTTGYGRTWEYFLPSEKPFEKK